MITDLQIEAAFEQAQIDEVHEYYFDAEAKAVELAVEYDVALICDDDPTGEIADGLIEGVLWREELRDAETRWQR